MADVIRIGARIYQKVEHGVFAIPYPELSDLHFNDVPYYSTLEVRNLPIEPSFFELTADALHAGGSHNEEFTISVKVAYRITGEAADSHVGAKFKRTRNYVRRVLGPVAEASGFHFGPSWMPYFQAEEYIYCLEALYRNFERAENPVIADVVRPFLDAYATMTSFRDTLIFICHASEDKPFVNKLCAILDSAGFPVWYDLREIRVGDSIVDRISNGLGQASHLAIVLSPSSTTKPWVLKEMSAALMRQITDSSVRVVPIVIDECTVPPILMDIRFADCRNDIDVGVRQLLEALR